jgi:deoxyribonuclease V
MKTVIDISTFPLNHHDAIETQNLLASKVCHYDDFEEIKHVAGVDIAYDKNSDKMVSGIAILDAKSLEVLETSTVRDHVQFEYIPGLLSFRELPAIAKALEQIKLTPDLIICDGQGLAHPRRFGVACHLGVVFNVPTIGCGKSRLIGEFQQPDQERGSFSHLIHEKEIIGAVVRTQNKINPVYVSIGHRVTLDTAIKWVLHFAPHYRLPETTRAADHLVREALKASQDG